MIVSGLVMTTVLVTYAPTITATEAIKNYTTLNSDLLRRCMHPPATTSPTC